MPSRRKPHPPRLCVTCGAEFVPTHGHQRYCGADCRPGYERTRESVRCPHCSQWFVRTHGNKRFWSPECLADFHNPRRVERPCAHCGALTLRWKFCSDECADPAKPPHRCTDCGEACSPGRGNHRYCVACKAKRVPAPKPKKVRYARVTKTPYVMRIRERPKTRVFIAGVCPCCRESFVAFAWTGSRYCSPECRIQLERQSRRNRQVAAEKSEPIYRRKVFERDNWTCRLCRKPVQQDALVPHPKAPTVDHILPLALGGSHTYMNVQCAHFICNSKKSANVRQLSFAA
jgi:hypothetical protein